jgi:hypothetical protein
MGFSMLELNPQEVPLQNFLSRPVFLVVLHLITEKKMLTLAQFTLWTPAKERQPMIDRE